MLKIEFNESHTFRNVQDSNLHQRIRQLEEQCQRLKDENTELLAKLAQEKSSNTLEKNKPVAEPSGNQISAKSPTKEKIALFASLFRGREDVYPERWDYNGKSGYSPAYDRSHGIVPKEERVYLPLTNQAIHDHLSGKKTIGIYPLLPDDTCWFLAADFDKSSWREDCLSFLDECNNLKLPASLEISRSGNGGHVWLFFSAPTNAGLARKLGAYLLTKTTESRPSIGLDSYDRLFPSQDTLPRGGFGNLIALPLQKEPRQQAGSIFVDESLLPYPDQWAYLSTISTIQPTQIEEIIDKAEAEGDLLGTRQLKPLNLDSPEPWSLKPSQKFCAQPLTGILPQSIQVTLANQLFIEKKSLPPSLINRLIRLAAFHNPEFYQAQARRFSTFNKPRIVHCAEEHSHHIALPRGCLSDLRTLCKAHYIEIVLQDERNSGAAISCQFLGELRPEQKTATDKALRYDDGVICAATAFGKTVAAAHLIAKRGVNTLIIVHRKQLQEQWFNRLSEFLDIPPSDIGLIGGGKFKPSGIIDIAIMQSLNRNGLVKDIVADYGHVIIDECHHLSAFRFSEVMNEVKARYIVGLTATPERKDGHHPIIFMQCGPIRYRLSAKEQAKNRPFYYRVVPVHTEVRFAFTNEPLPVQELHHILVNDQNRNLLIAQQVEKVIKENRNPLILTERTEHLDRIQEQLSRKGIEHVFVLKGGLGKKALKEIQTRMDQLPESTSRVILATGKYIGEGFDDSKLDTLFLVAPISWKGTLQQYVGRLHRLHEGKTEVRVYDYVDDDSPILASMFRKRLTGYRSMGYEIDYSEQPRLDFDSDIDQKQ